jgi:alkanesulfonate monooxygenase SsuD/methylene tetrahydromethanopterin reductase-like flavin-dependent oxidoreductase (luciferase family)
MDTDSSGDLKSLKSLFESLDETGYYSVLMVYHSELNDYFIKCANVLDKKLKIKYMPAIRTYAISPEYLSMMYDSFEEIQKGRLMFNVVAGDFKQDEKSLDNLIYINDRLQEYEQRVEYTAAWLEKFFEIRKNKSMPEIVISGTSDKTLESAEKYGDYSLCMIDSYLANKDKYTKIKNKMASAQVVIRETYEEANEFVRGIPENHKRFTLYGTEDQVISSINELAKSGLTDIMMRGHREDEETDRIHLMIKKITGEKNASI